MNNYQRILDFWFEGATDTATIDRGKTPFNKWFKSSPAFDHDIRRNFEEDFINARAGRYSDWENSPEGNLALILCFDQFTRNMYRDTPQMYSADPLAQALAQQLVKKKFDLKLQLIERVFVYMPFMHAEDRGLQERSLKLFEELKETSAQTHPHTVSYYAYTFKYARQHAEIVSRFGRFPHRNKILGRASTSEEIAFLSNPS